MPANPGPAYGSEARGMPAFDIKTLILPYFEEKNQAYNEKNCREDVEPPGDLRPREGLVVVVEGIILRHG